MTSFAQPRVHLIGFPLSSAICSLLTIEGEELFAVPAGCDASIAFDRAGDPFKASFWPVLQQREDGLWTPEIDGKWHRPTASISIGAAAPSLLSWLYWRTGSSDEIRVETEGTHAITVAVEGTRHTQVDRSLYLQGNAFTLGYQRLTDGLELRLSAQFSLSRRVHKDAEDIAASLHAIFRLDNPTARFVGWPGGSGAGRQVIETNWRPSQMRVGDAAISGKSLVAAGTLDWGGDKRYPALIGPWVSCRIEPGRMHLVPRAQLSLRDDGSFCTCSTEGELELNIGSDWIARALDGRISADCSFSGPGIGYVNSVTTWPLEQGGPRYQYFEDLTLRLKREEGAVRVQGEGRVGDGGDLGPQVAFDFVIPSLWFTVNAIRLD